MLSQFSLFPQSGRNSVDSYISQKLRKYNEILASERWYFGLFSLGVADSVFIFFCTAELVERHLLSLICNGKNTSVLSYHTPHCMHSYLVTTDSTLRVM